MPTRSIRPFTLIASSWLVAFLGACGDSQPDSNIRVTGLRTNVMNYHAAEQHQSNWCWAAAVQMVLSAYDLDLDQRAIVQRAFGQTVNRPGSPYEILSNLNGMVVNDGRQASQLHARCYPGPPTLEYLQLQLKNDIPVIVGYRNPGSDIGHAVVITAVIYELTPRGPEIVKVMVRDPSPMFRVNHGKRELSPHEFNNINQYYIVGSS